MLDHMAVLKGISRRGERRETVEALLHQVNLWDVRNKALAGFSGGMRQRFGIAQALIGNPTLIIVDEPTAGLDPEERNRFLNLLAEIGENVVVILSTHIVDDVSDLCQRMAIIAAGRIVRAGAPLDLIGELAAASGTRRSKRATSKRSAGSTTSSRRASSAAARSSTCSRPTAPGAGFGPAPAGSRTSTSRRCPRLRRAA